MKCTITCSVFCCWSVFRNHRGRNFYPTSLSQTHTCTLPHSACIHQDSSSLPCREVTVGLGYLGRKSCQPALSCCSHLQPLGISGELPECPSGLVFINLSHLQGLPPLSGSFFQSGSSPSAFHVSNFFSKTLILFSYRSPFWRLEALTFPSLNGLNTELQKVISLLPGGPFSCPFTDRTVQNVPFLFRPALIKIYSQSLLLQQTGFLLESSV